MNDVIAIKNITKKFGDLLANDNINFSIERGTVHSIIGENGAGKSTLMKIISGLIQPTDGQILIHNKEINFKNVNDAVKYGIGMVHQEFMLFPSLTVVENIILGYEGKNNIFIDFEQSRKNIEDICEKYHFNIPLDKKISETPVAIQQQVEIIKALYRGADIIILDEPTAVLTPQGIKGLFKAIEFLKSQEKTILFITHKLKEVLAISDKITVLKDGKVTGTVKPEDTDEAHLANLMVGRDVLMKVSKNDKSLSETIFECNNISVNLGGDKDKVKDINFQIKKGEILGIAGIAGNGQKELVEALLGFRKSSGGEIKFKNQDITSTSPREKRLLGIGYVPQDRSLMGSNLQSAVWENVIAGYHITHGFKSKIILDKNQAYQFTSKVIEKFNVKTPSPRAKAKSLSGGNLQKLIVGREFLQDYEFLIIEDPTRGIDIGAIEFIWNQIIKIAEQGVSILLVSHDLNEILSLSDRILVIYEGQITGELITQQTNEQEIGLLMTGGERKLKLS